MSKRIVFARKSRSKMGKARNAKESSSSGEWSSVSCGDAPNSSFNRMRLPSKKKIERWRKQNEHFSEFIKKVRNWKKEMMEESSPGSVSSRGSFDLSEAEWEDINYSREKEMNAWRIEGPRGESKKALDDWVEVPRKEKEVLNQELNEAFSFLKKSREELKAIVDDKASVSTDLSDMMERCQSVLELGPDREGDGERATSQGKMNTVVETGVDGYGKRNPKSVLELGPDQKGNVEKITLTDRVNIVAETEGDAYWKWDPRSVLENDRADIASFMEPCTDENPVGEGIEKSTKGSCSSKKSKKSVKYNATLVKKMVERSHEPYNLMKRRSELKLPIEGGVDQEDDDGDSHEETSLKPPQKGLHRAKFDFLMGPLGDEPPVGEDAEKSTNVAWSRKKTRTSLTYNETLNLTKRRSKLELPIDGGACAENGDGNRTCKEPSAGEKPVCEDPETSMKEPWCRKKTRTGRRTMQRRSR